MTKRSEAALSSVVGTFKSPFDLAAKAFLTNGQIHAEVISCLFSFSTLMRSSKLYRVAAFVVAFFGLLTNLIAAAQFITLWHNFKWELDSEWEWLGDRWRLDGLRIVGGLLCAYFASAAAISAVGLAGVIKVGPPLCLRDQLAHLF